MAINDKGAKDYEDEFP